MCRVGDGYGSNRVIYTDISSRIYYQLCESYRDEKGRPRQRVIRTLEEMATPGWSWAAYLAEQDAKRKKELEDIMTRFRARHKAN